VPLVVQLRRAVPVRVMIPERGMRTVARKGIVATIETLHVRRIKHNTVDLFLTIREVATVGARFDVRRKKLIFLFGNVLPENAFSESHIGDSRTAWDVEPQNLREDFAVVAGISSKDEFRRCSTVRRSSLCFHTRHSKISGQCAQVFSSSTSFFLCGSRMPLQLKPMDRAAPAIFLRLECSFYDEQSGVKNHTLRRLLYYPAFRS